MGYGSWNPRFLPNSMLASVSLKSQTHDNEHTFPCTGTHLQTRTHTVQGIMDNKVLTGFHNVKSKHDSLLHKKKKKYSSIYMLMVGGKDPYPV